jgi:hypothetical protein
MARKPGKSRPTRDAARKSPASTKTRAGAKRTVKRKTMPAPSGDPLDHFIGAAARAFDLPVEPQWRPAIKANLDVTLRLGALVAEFELPDGAEPAPAFGA